MKRTFFGKTATAQFKIHDEFNAKSQNTDSLNKYIHVYIWQLACIWILACAQPPH